MQLIATTTSPSKALSTVAAVENPRRQIRIIRGTPRRDSHVSAPTDPPLPDRPTLWEQVGVATDRPTHVALTSMCPDQPTHVQQPTVTIMQTSISRGLYVI